MTRRRRSGAPAAADTPAPSGHAVPSRRSIAVAVSGGRDSTALLHATARAAADAGGITVVALHVHHGLMPQADEWVAHLRRQCARWARDGAPVRFAWQRLSGAPRRGDSVEAWARKARYAALATMARQCGADAVLLAHHRQDQAETFLLQALRGGGPAALASMPAAVTRDGIRWLRPWLDHDPSAIEAYVTRHRLSHVHDGSNDDPRWARSRLRVALWPPLIGLFPDADHCLAAAASRAQEAAACLKEIAMADLSGCTDEAQRLQVGAWQSLSPARRANALREWLGAHIGAGAPQTLVLRLLRELCVQRAARWPAGQGELRCHDGLLSFGAALDTASGRAVPQRLAIDLARAGVHRVPAWHGCFEVTAAAGPGVPSQWLRHGELRQRSGGEQFQRRAGTLPRSLKKQFQAARVPAWERDGPLLFSGERLLYVPGLGIDARCIAPPGAPALVPRWLPDRIAPQV